MWALAWFASLAATVWALVAATEHWTLHTLVAGSVAVILSANNFRLRDYESTSFIAMYSAVSSMILGFHAWGAIPEHPIAFGAAVILGLVCVASLAFAYWSQSAPDPWPNLLQPYASAASEEDGVQLVIIANKATASTAEPFEIEVMLQNTFNAPRNIKVDFEPTSSGDKVQRPDTTVTLCAGEVVKLHVELACEHLVAESLQLEILLWVWGSGGRRVRRWRAELFARKVSPEKQMFMALGGHLTWGGGTFLDIKVVKATAKVPLSPTVRTESLWRPTEPRSAGRTPTAARAP